MSCFSHMAPSALFYHGGWWTKQYIHSKEKKHTVEIGFEKGVDRQTIKICSCEGFKRQRHLWLIWTVWHFCSYFALYFSSYQGYIAYKIVLAVIIVKGHFHIGTGQVKVLLCLAVVNFILQLDQKELWLHKTTMDLYFVQKAMVDTPFSFRYFIYINYCHFCRLLMWRVNPEH